MKKLLIIVLSSLFLFGLGTTTADAKGGGSSPSRSSSSSFRGTTYSAPKVGTRVVVKPATYNPVNKKVSPAVTATVPPKQTTGSTKRSTIGTPYSPSGYTDSKGRATVYSSVTHTYVAVPHPYFYSSYSMFGWHPFYGYYGCLYCFSGPYSYAPIPFAPVAYTQPSWAFDVEILVAVLLLLWLLYWLGGWRARRAARYDYYSYSRGR